MAKPIQIIVTVETSHVSGKFAGRDELVERLIEAIQEADPSTIDRVGADGTSEYVVESFEVEEHVA